MQGLNHVVDFILWTLIHRLLGPNTDGPYLYRVTKM